MTVFGPYAEWYDLFYADKDYRGEAVFVSAVLRAQGVAGRDLLEVGCGTGAHAQWLVADGWRLVGIDRSAGMLAGARARLGESGAQAASFALGDARDFHLVRRFDAAVSLFHVMSYQAEPGDFAAALASVRRHLRPDALFLFDFWYAPAVLAQRPEPRERVVENQRFHARRTATPTLHEAEHVVDVRYAFAVTDKASGTVEQLEELHRMRYFAPEELDDAARQAGFVPLALRAWLAEAAPDESTWNAFALWRVP